ncbi:MAG: hypothetical protein IPN53_25695 [Comamonadaceae bacterium]|nr:hypothetical protein [Comamonadaceae bacterium]
MAQIKIMEGKRSQNGKKQVFHSPKPHKPSGWQLKAIRPNKHLLLLDWALVEIDPTQDEPVVSEMVQTWSKGF